ncbi:TetR family transcriptional regulator [Streptomyces sp. 35G-GA-8]|uniref:TetR family transcriptional regulator n=1 Tax=Streptomyces sp. 35G-GA-8 TaxID=2939434 RepID=UPI00201EC099|nr:TetR family transcriptional regulator [Streptomyces sp. 35G-GA-8]MCL7381750.1 TetR family transcriptional regulator [Streptomyces sp. 35G-GA-8]
MAQQGPERRRNAAGTRQALLDAATTLFAERGFDSTTVRDIAGLAEANQALVFRYFGSKEALFEEVMAEVGRDQLATTPAEHLLATVLRDLLAPAADRDPSLEAFLRSGGNGGVVSAVREQLGEEYARVLRTLTARPDAALRADLVLAWLLGIGLLRVVAPKEPLSTADATEVTTLVLGAVSTLLERIDPAPAPARAPVTAPRPAAVPGPSPAPAPGRQPQGT